MGSHREYDSAIPIDKVSRRKPAGHLRAKPVQRRLAPVRFEGREIAADLLRKTLGDEEESMRHVARVLGVSKELVRKWCDPDDRRHFPVGDLMAVALTGSTTIVYAYLDELARWLMRRTREGRSPAQHAVEIAKVAAAATTALTDDSPREVKVRALRLVKRRCDEAMDDLEGLESKKAG